MTPRPVAAERAIPVPVARGLAFVPLVVFAGLQWMSLLEPHAPGRAWTGLLVATGCALALIAVGRVPGPARHVLAVLATVAAVVLALLAGGVPAELLRPARWGELASGISRGIDALPGVSVPYRGIDAWIRIVIPVGGTALMALAAAAAFWPRRGRLGRPLLAVALIVVLYAVPVIAIELGGEFLSGAVLAVLVLAFLRLEKLRLPDARLAAALAAGAAILGMAAAPALDENAPWFDYENWALDAASSKTTSYSWDHTYGPLDWPRDGREMLRVRAPHPAYWKAENLDDFDGYRWLHEDGIAPLPDSIPDDPTERRDWIQTIHVTVRNLRSEQFLTAGYTTAVDSPTLMARPRGDGTYLPGRPLARGDAYSATVYSPQPNERQRHLAPATDDDPVFPFLRLTLPMRGPAPSGEQSPTMTVAFPRYGAPGHPQTVITDPFQPPGRVGVGKVLEHGPYAGVWRLAERLKRDTTDQEDYVENVLAYLGDGFSYSEAPPAAAQTLAGFLLRARTGYCQQYSGAMALLLRMGGVPARVATGFTSGALDRNTGEYVARDLDAHSWVEAWYPSIGWVTFDPTPAVAPPRSQPDEAGTNGGIRSDPRAPNLPGDKAGTRRGFDVVDQPAPWWRIPLIVVAALAALGTAGWGARRARRPATPALVELERALRRSRRPLGPGTTLRALESAFARSPAAAAYVRAVRDARYGGRPGGPTRTQRAALRHELARGGGLAATIRAWWALPPL